MSFLFHVDGTARFRQAVRLVCSAVLCVSTWCGPIPWMHSHSLAGAKSQGLADHIHLHHLNTRPTEARPAADLGWHFHLLLLTELGTPPCGDENCPGHGGEPSLPLGLPFAYGASVLSGIDQTHSPLPLLMPALDFALLPEVVSISANDTSMAPRNGDAGRTPPLDRQALLCVARC